MKKLLAVLLAAIMLLGLTACSSGEKDEVVGTWKAVSASSNGAQMNTVPDITNEVRADGTFTYTFVGSASEGTWTNDNGTYTFTVGNQPVNGYISGGQLTMSSGSTTIVFEKK
ncbi:MAG: hypothetical protein IJM62_02315 [Lachnospiraceae bacterium]|nr:hypothetical protein [Lachnospiraceae bacterium]